MTKQDLIDLAIEYGMIRSSQDFGPRNEKQQDAILKQIKTVTKGAKRPYPPRRS